LDETSEETARQTADLVFKDYIQKVTDNRIDEIDIDDINKLLEDLDKYFKGVLTSTLVKLNKTITVGDRTVRARIEHYRIVRITTTVTPKPETDNMLDATQFNNLMKGMKDSLKGLSAPPPRKSTLIRPKPFHGKEGEDLRVWAE
jgi:hypothetical protein